MCSPTTAAVGVAVAVAAIITTTVDAIAIAIAIVSAAHTNLSTREACTLPLSQSVILPAIQLAVEAYRHSARAKDILEGYF